MKKLVLAAILFLGVFIISSCADSSEEELFELPNDELYLEVGSDNGDKGNSPPPSGG